MTMRRNLLLTCLALSTAWHLLVLSALGPLGPLETGAPVPFLAVELNGTPPHPDSDTAPSHRSTRPTVPLPVPSPGGAASATNNPPPATLPEPIEPAAPATVTAAGMPGPNGEPAVHPANTAFVPDPPVRASGEFMASRRERLVYRISLLGVPVGIAELEAANEAGELRISLKIRSDEALSAFYPVDDLIETRHINGNFIVTRIRQREGSFRSDRGFTIFIRDRKVFWIDRLTNRSTREQIPNTDVVDLLSGLYFLRNRPLQVGGEETLHIYDSDAYSEVPVTVIRSETVSLPAFREADTLLIRPRLKTGVFRLTGELHLWLSNDRFRVPVKIAASIPLGEITAELVAAENGAAAGATADRTAFGTTAAAGRTSDRKEDVLDRPDTGGE